MYDRRFTEFIRLFNEETFYEAHEVLEDLWLATDGRMKPFYKGLIQCAVALAHCQRGNLRGMSQVGERALAALRQFDPIAHGIQLERLIRDCEAFLASPSSNFPRIHTSNDRSPESPQGMSPKF
jgi:predicted metal-dependent hydrolase